MFDCDSARVLRFPGKMFLIIGWKRSTKDDRIIFDYLQEQVIASGSTEAELLLAAREYKRISKMSPEQHFKELTGEKHGQKPRHQKVH